MEIVRKLLLDVKTIVKHYESIAEITGENFNVFKILGVQSNEVRLHSAFLAEFLDPHGSHGQSDKYFKLFKDLFNEHFKGFSEIEIETSSAEVFVEYFSGKISDDYEKGGRLDILIKDKFGKSIIIENKIYAGDQPKQLKRYKDFDNKSKLLYLNLFGENPSNESKGELERGKDFDIISYDDFILKWLEECVKESVTLPIIRETLQQYIQLIKYLTGKSIHHVMNEQIIELLKKNPDYISAVKESHKAYNSILQQVRDSFEESIKSFEFGLRNYPDFIIQTHLGEDQNGLYFAFRVVKKGNNSRYNAASSTFIKKEENQEIKVIFNKIEPIIKEMNLNQSNWSLAWKYPDCFKGRKKIDDLNAEIIDFLNKENKYNEIINEIKNNFEWLKTQVQKIE